MEKKLFSSKNVTYLSVLLAFVIVLQLFGSYFKIGATTFSFVLLPIVLGGVLLGPVAGLILGFAFGFTVLLMGVFGIDAFTMILFNDSPIITSLICLVKGIAAGVVPAFIYKFFSNKSKYSSVFAASAAAPIVNTGLFIVGALFLKSTLQANFIEDGTSIMYFLIIGCAGVNFLVELAINLVLAPALYRVSEVVSKFSK